ncbi:MAG: hypothetical protein HUJ96_07940 [Marinilabiliaceae bacterium]|nr:hypothetical protein [Marinilabiliaceae bacterium]
MTRHSSHKKQYGLIDFLKSWQLTIGTVILFVFVQICQRYILFDMEQTRVFVYEADKIAAQLSSVGGVSDFIALWLQQFFAISYVAPLVVALLYGGLTWLLQRVCSMVVERDLLLVEMIISWLPAVFLFVYTEDKIFFLTGHIAMLISVLGLWCYATCLSGRLRPLRLILIPLLFLVEGFVSSTCVWVMVLGMMLIAICRKEWREVGTIVLSSLLMLFLAQRYCIAVGAEELFSPDIFTIRIGGDATMIWVWLSSLLLIAIVILNVLKDRVRDTTISVVLAFSIVLLTGCFSYKSHKIEETHESLWLQRQIDTGNVVEAFKYCERHINNLYIANIYSYLLSTIGRLGDSNIFEEEEQLIIGSSESIIVRRHLMTLNYYIGYVAGAQREAFELNEPTEGMMRPRALMILAKTNIIQGNYALADKYLSHLKNTLFYRSWAQSYSRFLWDDKAVEADEELGSRRKAIEIESIPERWTAMKYLVSQIAAASPTLPATQYVDAYANMGAYDK